MVGKDTKKGTRLVPAEPSECYNEGDIILEYYGDAETLGGIPNDDVFAATVIKFKCKPCPAATTRIVYPPGYLIKSLIRVVYMVEPITIDASRFPHKCPHCKAPAYIGAINVECSAKCPRSI